MIQFDPLDPQADWVYRAQSVVINAHPEDNVQTLSEVRAFIATITTAEGVKLTGVHRVWMHTGPSGSVVDRGGVDRDLTGQKTKDPVDHSIDVKILPWDQRYSHYEQDFNEIAVAAPTGWPLSHKLLLVHEVAHAIEHGTEKHGTAWCQEFMRLTAIHLPHMSQEPSS